MRFITVTVTLHHPDIFFTKKQDIKIAFHSTPIFISKHILRLSLCLLNKKHIILFIALYLLLIFCTCCYVKLEDFLWWMDGCWFPMIFYFSFSKSSIELWTKWFCRIEWTVIVCSTFGLFLPQQKKSFLCLHTNEPTVF